MRSDRSASGLVGMFSPGMRWWRSTRRQRLLLQPMCQRHEIAIGTCAAQRRDAGSPPARFCPMAKFLFGRHDCTRTVAVPEHGPYRRSLPIVKPDRGRTWLYELARRSVPLTTISTRRLPQCADKPGFPIRHTHLGPIALGHLGRVRLDPMPAIEAPHDKVHARRGSVAERHRWAAVRFHV